MSRPARPGENAQGAGSRPEARRSERGQSEAAERVSPSALEQAALRYLNRYDASVEQLRRVLFRYVARSAQGDERARAEQDVRALLERYQASRLLDDARYAEALARGLRARGSSARGIVQKLRARGVAPELAAEALERLTTKRGEGEDPELVAARAYARKRRLSTRYDLSQPSERQKALAALARKGFSFSIAQQALAVSGDVDSHED